MNNRIIFFLFLGLIWMGCQEEDSELGDVIVPSNLEVEIDIDPEGSGLVQFQATAENAIAYHYYFGNAADEDPVVSMDGKASNNYRRTGLNTYNVRVIAYGTAGASTSYAEEIDVRVDFEVPEEIVSALTGGSSKNWYWAQSLPGHLGVGPPSDDNGAVSEPIWYAATPDEKESEGCFYTDTMTFSLNANNQVVYQLDNNGVTYFHVDEVLEATGMDADGDTCADWEVSPQTTVLFAPINSGVTPSTNVQMQFGNGLFMSYYVDNNEYEIMSITDTELRVRVIQNGALAWYHIFTSERE